MHLAPEITGLWQKKSCVRWSRLYKHGVADLHHAAGLLQCTLGKWESVHNICSVLGRRRQVPPIRVGGRWDQEPLGYLFVSV